MFSKFPCFFFKKKKLLLVMKLSTRMQFLNFSSKINSGPKISTTCLKLIY